jgi:hypothetical protein
MKSLPSKASNAADASELLTKCCKNQKCRKPQLAAMAAILVDSKMRLKLLLPW